MLKSLFFVSLPKICEANILGATKEIHPSYFGTVFNIGNGSNISIKEIANLISEDQVFIAPREAEVDQNLADISKAKEILGWEPKVSVEEWIKLQNNF